MEEDLSGEEDSTSRDDEGLSNFMAHIRAMPFPPLGVPRSHYALPFMAQAQQRSYARNANHAGAGASAENALEITDDTDDDEDIQVVSANGRRRM